MQRERKPNSSSLTNDLDIAFYENKIMEYVLNRSSMGKHFVLPHPETHKEAHVIVPLANVTPNFVHPPKKSLSETLPGRLVLKTTSTLCFPQFKTKAFCK